MNEIGSGLTTPLFTWGILAITARLRWSCFRIDCRLGLLQKSNSIRELLNRGATLLQIVKLFWLRPPKQVIGLHVWVSVRLDSVAHVKKQVLNIARHAHQPVVDLGVLRKYSP